MNKELEMPVYLFHQGTALHAYELLGAHFECREEGCGCVFRVWAPHAAKVSIIGEFNDWNERSAPLKKITKQGLWEVFVLAVKEYDMYKYVIEDRKGLKRTKTDPFAFHLETRPGTASKVYSLAHYPWSDDQWMQHRQHDNPHASPINIYEVHLGSWRQYADGQFFDYRKMAQELIPYVVDMGYTHLEFMPVSEYPYDGSWGYQVLGYFAPTSRFGTPDDFRHLIDQCHQAGIGVILDWVPGHFPKDAEGLSRFDGQACYEYKDSQKGEHKEWGTHLFDWGRNEVRSFLLSNAIFWFEQYHIDGLRVDAVASMLYLDYGRKKGQWGANTFGGRENLEAVAFLKDLNKAVFAAFPNVLMIAEESTSWPMVTAPVDQGGLGFNFKWNMGWMNDTLQYMKTDPIYRRTVHEKLTFSLTYAFTENYILPLSHDEVVHLKASLLSKMPGSYENKFAALRAYYAYMMAHPGKKLLFMGGEIGQFSEWNFRVEIDWNLLAYEMHQKLQDYVKALNGFYRRCPCFWEQDTDWNGFRWIWPDDRNENIISFSRIDRKGDECIVVCNFAAIKREHYLIGVMQDGEYEVVFSTEEPRFGGCEAIPKPIRAKENSVYKFPYSIQVTLPALSAYYMKRR